MRDRLPAIAVTSAAVLAVVVGVVMVSRSPQPPATAPTETTPSPTPSPTPEPVEGEVSMKLERLHRPERKMFAAGEDGTKPRRKRAQRLARGVGGWLDRHLTDLQDGEELGRIGGGLVPDDPGDNIAPITTALASPDRWVEQATYRVRVGIVRNPLWARVHVRTVDVDGGKHHATFVFVPSDDGPRLVAAGPRQQQ